jgi:hypothetical protein
MVGVVGLVPQPLVSPALSTPPVSMSIHCYSKYVGTAMFFHAAAILATIQIIVKKNLFCLYKSMKIG